MTMKVKILLNGMYIGTEKMTSEEIRKAEAEGFTVTNANQNTQDPRLDRDSLTADIPYYDRGFFTTNEEQKREYIIQGGNNYAYN